MTTDLSSLATRIDRIEGVDALSVCVVDLIDGAAYERNARQILPIASTAKVLVLAELSGRLERGDLYPGSDVPLADEDRCDGTGLARHLSRSSWSLWDLATLVAAVSDNTATNALLRVLGRDAVNGLARTLELRDTSLHDRIRDRRTTFDPPHFATGTSRDLADLMGAVHAGQLAGAERLLRLLALNTDHTLLCAGLGHDPWEVASPVVWHKTGIDVGVRADVGLLGGRVSLAWAAIATAPAGCERRAIEALRATGEALRAHVALDE